MHSLVCRMVHWYNLKLEQGPGANVLYESVSHYNWTRIEDYTYCPGFFWSRSLILVSVPVPLSVNALLVYQTAFIALKCQIFLIVTLKSNLSWTLLSFICCSKSSMRSEGGWDSRLTRQQTAGGEVSVTFTLKLKPCSHCASTFSSAVRFGRFKTHSHRPKVNISFCVSLSLGVNEPLTLHVNRIMGLHLATF